MATLNSEIVVERRTKILKMEGDGFARPDIVKTLAQEFQCSKRTLQRDIEIREKWQPQITQLTDKKQAYYSILNRYEQIYQKASFTFQQSKNESVTIAALRVMLDTLSRIKELANISNEQGDATNSISVGWRERSDSLKATLETNNKWKQWVEGNCSPEERQLINDMTRLWIRYEYATNPELNQGESIH